MTRSIRVAALLCLLLGACRSRPEPSEPDRKMPPTAESTLSTVTVTSMPESERGGSAIVLLHGYGAAGDDLVPFARQLLRPKTRIFVPAAPLVAEAGRAWWSFDPSERPVHAWDDTPPAGYRGSAQLVAARLAVERLLGDIRRRFAPEHVVLGGFSQGAMLSLDVGLVAEPPVDRVLAMSGVLVADSLPALRSHREQRPRFLLSHGRSDEVLKFGGAEAADRLLRKYGHTSELIAFDGGHTIPRELLPQLTRFLFED